MNALFLLHECFFHRDGLHRTHLLATEAGDTFPAAEPGFPVSDLNDMRRTALRTLSAAHAFLRNQLWIGAQEMLCNPLKGSSEDSRYTVHKIQPDAFPIDNCNLIYSRL